MELGGEGKGKENNRELTILKYMISVQVEDIMMCMEAFE
jgi:hypothetical protein